MTNSNEIMAYRSNTHHRCDNEFYEGSNRYVRIGETEKFYLYEVEREEGATYYEIIKRGNIYHKKEGEFENSQLNEGDEMYPINEEFGKLGWCFSNREYAMKRWNRLNGNNNYDGYIELAKELVN